MKKIALLEKVINKEIDYSKVSISGTFFNAYIATKRDNLKFLNIDDFFSWEKDIPKIIEDCKAFDIKKITISSNQTSMIGILAKFTELGCKIMGFTEITTFYENKPIKAIVLKVF